MSPNSNGQMLAYIDDAQGEHFFIKGSPRLYPDVRGEFRPCLYDEQAGFFRANQTLGPKEETARACTLMKGKLVSWNLVQRNGDPLPISEANLRRLRPALQQRLLAIILGVEAPDEDPTASHDQAGVDAADKVQAAESGAPFRPGS